MRSYTIGNLYRYDSEKDFGEQLEEGINLFYKKFLQYPEIAFFHPKNLEKAGEYKMKNGKRLILEPNERELITSFVLGIGLDK